MRRPLRMAARLLTGSTYVLLGVDAARAPGARVDQAAATLAALRKVVPVQVDDELIVRGNGAVQVVGGALLASGTLPRLAALALAGSMIPTTVAGHAGAGTTVTITLPLGLPGPIQPAPPLVRRPPAERWPRNSPADRRTAAPAPVPNQAGSIRYTVPMADTTYISPSGPLPKAITRRTCPSVLWPWIFPEATAVAMMSGLQASPWR